MGRLVEIDDCAYCNYRLLDINVGGKGSIHRCSVNLEPTPAEGILDSCPLPFASACRVSPKTLISQAAKKYREG